MTIVLRFYSFLIYTNYFIIPDSLAFCEPFEIVPFDDTMTEIYGKIKASLEVKGMKIGFNDNIIAATVLARKGILVTNNTREFNRVDGLLIEDWAQE